MKRTNALSAARSLVERARCAAASKLHSTAGDTLIEVLAALLISVMAVTLMATMIMTATSVTSKNDTRMAQLYAAQSSLSSGGVGATAGTATISDKTGYSRSVTIDIYAADGLSRYEGASDGRSGS